MPLSRPNTVVYQEYTDLSVVPATPFLNTLIVGPCYQLLDYLDDKADCAAGEYGTLQMNNPRTSPTAAVVIATPPELEAGAILEDDSVKIFFDEAQVELVASGTDYGTFYASDNLMTTTDVTGVHMGISYVAAGDTLIVESSNTAVDYVKTVKELAYSMYVLALDFTALAVDTGDIITVSADTKSPSRDGSYTVKKKYIVNGSVVVTHLEVENSALLLGGAAANAHVTITSAAGVSKYTSIGGVKVSLGDWCNVRVTEDFADVYPNSPGASTALWRVERQLSDVELASTDITVNNITKTVTVKAGVTAIVSTTIGAKPVTFAEMYMEYVALRQDLQNVAEVTSSSEAIALLGKYDARNPLCVGVHVSLANSSTPIKVYGLAADTLAGYTDFVERTSHLNDIYAVCALTYDTSIIGYLKGVWENYADPTYVLTHGIKQKFRAVLGGVDLVTQSEVISATAGSSTLTKAGTTPAGNKTITIVSQVGQAVPTDFSANGVLPGDIVTITLGGVAQGPYTVAHVNSAMALEVEEALPNLVVSSNALDHMTIKDPTGVTTRCTMVHTAAAFTLDEAVLDALYLTLSSSTSEFITDGVVPGDLLQIPTDPESSSFTTYDTWVIAAVDSETRVTVVNGGNNTADLQNELPHLIKRTAATDRVVSAGTVYFRIKRNMTKTEQVNYMLAVAQSLDSKRAILCYPNSVDITDLVDGSLTRTGTDPEVAAAQPGYYLACLVGGQTASQPSQQGFTNLGGNGIDRIYNSNDYFSEEQLTNLSNGGVYVFVQDAPAALPYTIHEVTTDVLSLETGEYMHVKNLDYLSMSFLETLRPFNGKWNITPDAIQFITQALYAGINTHKTAYRARIGAPMIDGTVRTVFQNTDVSEDRIEAYVDADLPSVLNTIGLHLVA
jgi:hypothetical protein